MRKKHATSRDMEMLATLEEYNLVMSTNQIARMFYNQTNNLNSALTKAKTRLCVLVELDYIYRNRNYINQSYTYSVSKKPIRNYEHKLMLSEMVVVLKENNFEIEYVKPEYKVLLDQYGIQPDALIKVAYNGIQHLLLVECDRTKKFTNSSIYAQIHEDWLFENEVHKAYKSYEPLDKDGSKMYGERLVLHDVFETKPLVISFSKSKPDTFNYDEDKSWKPIWVSSEVQNCKNLIGALPLKW